MRDVTGVQRMELIPRKAEHPTKRAVRPHDASIDGDERHRVGGVLEGIREKRLALWPDGGVSGWLLLANGGQARSLPIVTANRTGFLKIRLQGLSNPSQPGTPRTWGLRGRSFAEAERRRSEQVVGEIAGAPVRTLQIRRCRYRPRPYQVGIGHQR